MSHNESLSLEMLRDGTGAAVRDNRGRPLPRRDAHFALETCVLPSRTTVGTALSSAKCTSRRRGLPPWSPSDPRRPSRGSAAALVVRICCKGPDPAEAREGNRWYSALLLAADPSPGRLCNRFGHTPALNRHRSPTRTTLRPPARATTTIPAGPGNFLVRRAHCAASGREECGTRGEKHALAAFLNRRTARPPVRPRPLRPFPSATPFHPPLHEKKKRSGG